MPLLYNAAAAGDLCALQAALATADADLEGTDCGDYTAFLLACKNGHAECIAALAEAGCDTAARSSNGCTGLLHATLSGSAAAVEAVLAVGGAELEATAPNGCTAFLLACSEGSAECIAALAEAGCDTFATMCRGGAPLHDTLEIAPSSVRPLIEAAQQKQRLREATKVQAQKRAELIESAKALVDANESMQDLETAIVMVDRAELDESLGAWSHTQSGTLAEVRREAEKLCVLREQKALQAEAELMALLDGEEQGAAASDARAADKVRKKKEKRKRQLQQRAQAKAVAAEEENAASGVGPLEPEPEVDVATPRATQTNSNTKKKKNKKKKKKKKKQR